MARRRDNSRIFGIGDSKSPHVLDLSRPKQVQVVRSNKNTARRKKPKKNQDEPVSRESILSEIENIESYDAKLASSLNMPLSIKRAAPVIQAAEDEGDEFLRKELGLFLETQKSSKTPEPFNAGLVRHRLVPGHYQYTGSIAKSSKKVFGFTLISGIVTLLILGAFFIQENGIVFIRGISDNESVQKNSEPKEILRVTQPSSKFAFAFDAIKSFSFEGMPDLGNKIPSILNTIGIAKDFYGIAPALFGYDEPKKYIIIFQNSSELRPTGGFIGTYAIAEMSEGEIQDIFIDGIYNIDGQLTVNVVPPRPLQHISTAWSTHDANWFFDFPTSAEKIMWFYEKTGGGNLDGVISLNVEVIEQLLGFTGPIILSEYDLILDAQNFRDEIQYQVEVAYDKELNKPKKVLADFAPSFFEKFSDILKSSDKINELIPIIAESLEEKSIMFYSKDSNVQEFFEKQGWSGSIYETDSTQQTTDYLAVVHSNIGGHKTSKYMQDEVIHNIEIRDDGSIIARLTLKRTHNGGDTKYWWYNRKNIDYVKIYVPEDSELISYSGGVRRDSEGPVDYEALRFTKDTDVIAAESGASMFGPIDIFTETGKTVFGTWLVTSPKKSTEFEISFKLPFKVEFKNEIAKYNLYLQKQPGTRAQTNVSISYPDFWNVIWGNANSYEEPFALDKDRMAGYIFER